MHELSIVFDVIDQVEKIAKENHVKRVDEITLELGEVSSVIPDYFRDCFYWAIKKSTYMKECKCNIIVLKAQSFCKKCKKTFDTSPFGKECPNCHSHETYLLCGDEINIRDIKVTED